MDAYITSIGKFLPGDPIPAEQVEEYIGAVGPDNDEIRDLVLKNSGIKTRHYAIDRDQRTRFSNVELATRAIADATERRGIATDEIDLLAVATSSGDVLGPAHAPMVHGALGNRPCEVVSVNGLCCAGMIALKSAYLQVRSGEHRTAVACGSELTSRLFKSSHYPENHLADGGLPFDIAFMRYMLSDGAGAAVIEPEPSPTGLSLKIEWVSVTSYANTTAPCMYIGTKHRDEDRCWQDYPTFGEAAADGAIALRQDMRLLPRLVKTAVDEYQRLVEAGLVRSDEIDYAAVHYSSEALRPPVQREFARRGLELGEERWFSNLTKVGNIGCAAIYVILEELLNDGHLEPGQKVLGFVPESGRFTMSFMLLEVVGPGGES